MLRILLTRLGKYDGTGNFWFELPVTDEQQANAFAHADVEKGAEDLCVVIRAVHSDIKQLETAIKPEYVQRMSCISKLNALAEAINEISEVDSEKLSDALSAESITGLDDILHIAANLDCASHIPSMGGLSQ